jgi:hypothetical protein
MSFEDKMAVPAAIGSCYSRLDAIVRLFLCSAAIGYKDYSVESAD